MAYGLRKIVLVVEYDGTNYCGFQYQLNGPTIQDEIEKALFRLTNEKVRLAAASRTDAGVHAERQVVSFRTSCQLKRESFISGTNFYLPQDIAVKASYQVNSDFNVRREAISREYCYYLLNSRVRSPLKRHYAYLAPASLDIEEMNKAAQFIVGQHDLISFVTEIGKSSIKSTSKRVFKAQVMRCGELTIIDVIAEAFLPHQIRNTVGTLIRVGMGKITKDDFRTIMEAKIPGLAGPTVPARGLFLKNVNYPRPLGEYDEDL